MNSSKYQRTYYPVILYGFNFITANSLQATLLLRQQGVVNFILTVWNVWSNKINRKNPTPAVVNVLLLGLLAESHLPVQGGGSKLVRIPAQEKAREIRSEQWLGTNLSWGWMILQKSALIYLYKIHEFHLILQEKNTV